VDAKPDTLDASTLQRDPSCLTVHITKKLSPDPAHIFHLDAAFVVPPGITILFGPSGAGKTTILQCISGLLQPDAGKIAIGAKAFFDAAQQVNVGVAQRSVGYVFQNLALFPHLAVGDNVQYGLRKLEPRQRRERTHAILESFHIAHLLKRKPNEISAGERQRVALARSLVTDPCLLLLDEPLASLDVVTKSWIIEDLRLWNAARRIPILYVTHAREEVFALGERVIVMEQGKILAQGTPQQVLEAPRQEMVAQLAGFENIFDAEVVSSHEDQGTMTCRLAHSNVRLEVPLASFKSGATLRLGVRAGDILLASEQPRALSARNILPGKVLSLVQRDFIAVAEVDCGIRLQVHLTLGASKSLELAPDRLVWLVIKTHSCHLLRPAAKEAATGADQN